MSNTEELIERLNGAIETVVATNGGWTQLLCLSRKAATALQSLKEENARLREALQRIDRINDNPMRFNSEINQVVEAALELASTASPLGKDQSAEEASRDAIRNALAAVAAMGEHPLLADASDLLRQASEMVSDYIERNGVK